MIWGPLVAIFDFASGAALQVVRYCKRCGIAGGADLQGVSKSPLLLGWYY